jgi:hypothetical protein
MVLYREIYAKKAMPNILLTLIHKCGRVKRRNSFGVYSTFGFAFLIGLNINLLQPQIYSFKATEHYKCNTA